MRALILLLALVVPCGAGGQAGWADTAPVVADGIQSKDVFEVGDTREFTFVGAESAPGIKTARHWTVPPKVQSASGASDGRLLLAWAPPCSYTLTMTVKRYMAVFVPDPADPTNPAKAKPGEFELPPIVHTKMFRVGGVVVPDAPATGLSALVPNPEHRALLAEFFDDLAGAVEENKFDTIDHFRAGYRKSVADAKADGVLPAGLSAIDKPISDMIGAAIPLTGQFTEQTKQALVAVLDKIAADFGGK